MTLIYEGDLDILKMYLNYKNEVPRSRLSKVRDQTRQIDMHTQTDVTKCITTLHSRMVMISSDIVLSAIHGCGCAHTQSGAVSGNMSHFNRKSFPHYQGLV